MTHPDSELTRRERKKQATRSLIIDMAMSLFRQNGFHQTSMEQIAEASDVSKATLYNYFAVKEAIIAAYWQRTIGNSKDALQRIIKNNPDTRSRLRAAFISFMHYISQSRQLYEIYISYRMQHMSNPEINEKLRSGAAHGAAAILELGQKSGEIRTDIPLPMLVANLEMLHVMQSMIWLHHPEKFSIEGTSEMLTELFLQGAAHVK